MTPSGSLDRRRFVAVGVALGGRLARGAAGPVGGWDADAVDLIATLPQPGWAQAVAFSRDGKMLAAAGFAAGGVEPSWITTWEVGTWKRLRSIAVPEMRIDRIAVAPDGRSVVAAGRDESRLIVGELSSGKVRDLVRLPGTGGMPMAPTFTPEGKYLISGNDEEGVRIWSADNFGQSQRLDGTRDGGFQVVVAPSEPWEGLGGRAFALGQGGTLFRVQVNAGKPRDAIVPPGARYVGPPQFGLERVRGVDRPWSAGSLTISRDGRAAAYLSLDSDGRTGRIATFAVDKEGEWTARAKLPLDVEPHTIYALTFTPDGRALVAGCGAADMDIRRWDVATGRALAPLSGHMSSVAGFATAPAGWLASAGNADFTVRVWRPRVPEGAER